MLISMQGSDVYNESTKTNDYEDMPTFSNEDGGMIKAFGNIMPGKRRFVPYDSIGSPNPRIDFDAYVAKERNEIIGDTVLSAFGANRYNNFDTNPLLMYAYAPDSAKNVPDKVMKYAGRILGGDFKWAFTNSTDDTSYDVNAALKTALTSYTTSLVSVQGDSTGTIIIDPEEPEEPEGDVVVHNFTTDGKTSTFFAITGSLSTSKGTVAYEGLTLTQCIKIESSTKIVFTLSEEANLTLVFNDNFTGKIKIDGISYSAAAGVVSLDLATGVHEITKDEVANLFYIKITYKNTIKDNLLVSDQQIENGSSRCYNAYDTLTVAGDGKAVLANIGAIVNFISGKSIRFLPGFHAHEGSVVHAWITTTDEFCNKQPQLTDYTGPLSAINESVAIPFTNRSGNNPPVRIYPNPNKGRFIVEYENNKGPEVLNLVDLQGKKVLFETFGSGQMTEIELKQHRKGIYLLILNDGITVSTRKIIVK